MKLIILFLIRIYQIILSPDHGFFKKATYCRCRFLPTCSEYSYQAIKKYGLIKGSLKSFHRISKCHPFNEGGYDPI